LGHRTWRYGDGFLQSHQVVRHNTHTFPPTLPKDTIASPFPPWGWPLVNLKFTFMRRSGSGQQLNVEVPQNGHCLASDFIHLCSRLQRYSVLWTVSSTRFATRTWCAPRILCTSSRPWPCRPSRRDRLSTCPVRNQAITAQPSSKSSQLRPIQSIWEDLMSAVRHRSPARGSALIEALSLLLGV